MHGERSASQRRGTKKTEKGERWVEREEDVGRNGGQCLLLLSDWSSRAGVGGEDTGETDSEEGPPVAIF